MRPSGVQTGSHRQDRATRGALIFDFDGVVADSEALANAVLAEQVSLLGQPTTLDDALARFCGRRWSEAMGEIERHVGRPLPAGFSQTLRDATFARFETDLKEVQGARRFIRRFDRIPRCIASSSSTERLALCLRILGLAETFAGRVFSADEVARGKPHPDIFLLAASRLGAPPQDCLVIEDSVGGVQAAVAAGMTTIGLSAASHIRDGHAERLTQAGAVHLASSWAEAEGVADRFFAARARR